MSGSDDNTIKVWDATPRPYNASEWEKQTGRPDWADEDDEVEEEDMVEVWVNTVTGDKRFDESAAGKPFALEPPIKGWDSGASLASNRLSLALTDAFFLPMQPHWS